MSDFRGSQKHLLELMDKFGAHLPVFNQMLSGFAEIGGFFQNKLTRR